MPLYEFNCNSCGQSFEELLRSSEAVLDVSCPICSSRQVTKKMSRIAARPSVMSGFSLGASAAASCNTGST